MRREKGLQILGAGLVLLATLLVALSFAGESPNYRSYLQVIDCGGGVSSSDTCRSGASIAQPAVGTTRNESHTTDAGYMRTATAPLAPMTNKEITIPQLEEIKEQVPPWAEVEIDGAIEHILKSLDSLLWVDAWHLNADPIPALDEGEEGKDSPGEEPALTDQTPIRLRTLDRYWDYDGATPALDSNTDAVWHGLSSEPPTRFSRGAAVGHGSDWETRSGDGKDGPRVAGDPNGPEDPHRYGSLVFKWEEKAAKKIMNLALHIPRFAEELGEVIEDLLTADSTLAQVAIDEAEAGGGDPKKLKKAKEQMERAERAKSRGDFDAAIAYYGEAWGHAVDALSSGGPGGPQAAKTADIPLRFAVSQNCPNPFSSATIIRYSLPLREGALNHTVQGGDGETGRGGDSSIYERIKLSIYDVTGRLVRVLVDGKKEAGQHSMRWNARDDAGRRVSAGIYFYRLEARPSSSGHASDLTGTKKMILLR